MKILTTIKNFIKYKIFGKIIREYKFKKRMKEIRKRDPFIYK
jgi:hypothetical protein